MNRPRGWIQDSGSLENLIKVVELFDNYSETHNDLIETQIPRKIHNSEKKNQLLQALNNRDGFAGNPLISFRTLVGKRTAKNVVDSVIQCLIPGQNRVGIVDWACDNFVRFAYTLNFISYNESLDSFTITEFGLEFTQTNSIEGKFRILEIAFKKYSPAVRVLELLYNQYENHSETPSLTKFEIGKELGFKGEDGFTTYSQNVFIQALNSVTTINEKNKIRQNWEGSSDKYARMICGWLMNDSINWIKKSRKNISVQIGNETFIENLQSYQITISGISAFRSCRAYSSNSGTPKNIFFEMLATKGADKEYLRIRRTHILQSIRQSKNIDQIIRYLSNKNLQDILKETIEDDIKNFSRIGLEVSYNNHRYKLKDSIELLEIPNYIKQFDILPSNLEQTKQVLRGKLKYLDHNYLDILDLSIAGRNHSTQFEVRIVELLNQIIVAKHLSGGNRPEIIGYNPNENPTDCIIMDSKAYNQGFAIPANERDKMIRYIEEYKLKDLALNSNKWWENYKSPDYPVKNVKFSFVSSKFIGQFLGQLAYIINRTNRNGCAITAESLLLKVDNVIGNTNDYNLNSFFDDLGSNKLVN